MRSKLRIGKVVAEVSLTIFPNASSRGRQCPRHTVYLVYITGGTVIPITANVRISSRRTTATVASRNCFRFSSGSLRMGWR